MHLTGPDRIVTNKFGPVSIIMFEVLNLKLKFKQTGISMLLSDNPVRTPLVYYGKDKSSIYGVGVIPFARRK